MSEQLPTVTAKPLRPHRYGHPWLYDNEVADAPGADECQPGEIVRIVDHNGKVLGLGFYNPKSKIPVRRITTNPEATINAAFWRNAVARASDYRKERFAAMPQAYRVVHGEADDLPGLVVDRYGSFLVIQVLSAGIELIRKELIASLVDEFAPQGIFERSESAARRLEGLEPVEALVYGEAPPDVLEIEDGGATLLVDIAHGAKTGLFLDQLANQKAAAANAYGRRVLNCFSYTGIFGLRAAMAGAKSVTDVDASAAFLEIAEKQWRRNNIKVPREALTANVFDLLRRFDKEKYRTDMVVLDPPAFTKTRASADSASRGYYEINRRAFRILAQNGILVTCSCSHHVMADEFRAIVERAASDAGRVVRIIENRGQPADHAVRFGIPETEYLKCLILAVE